jgi:hypothetical protein
MEFSRYELQFEPNSGQAEILPEYEEIEGGTFNITLEEGDWTITAIAFVNISGVEGIRDGEYKAARGSTPLTVKAGSPNEVSIDIERGVETGEGVFHYDISYPQGMAAAALEILTVDGMEASPVKEVDLLKNGSSGSFALDAGYYILLLNLEKDEKKIVKVEVIHIYKNMTTRAVGTDYNFTDEDFFYVEAGQEEPGKEEPGKEEPGKEEPGKEEPGKEEPGKEEPGKEEPGKEEPGKEEPGKEEPGKEEPGKEEPGKEDPGKEEPGKEEPGKEEPGKEEPGKEEPGKEEPGKEEPGKEEPGKEEPGKEEPGKEVPGKEEPGKEEPGKEEPGKDTR